MLMLAPDPSAPLSTDTQASRFTFLRSLETFAALPVAWVNELASRSLFETRPRGTTLYREGDDPRSLSVVASGGVVLVREPLGRPAVRLASLSPGDLVGGGEVWSGEPRISTARTTAPTRLLRVGREDLLGLTGRMPDLAIKLQLAAARQASRRMAGALESEQKRIRYRTEVEVAIRIGREAFRSVLLDLSLAGVRLAPAPPLWSPSRRIRCDLETPVGVLPIRGRVVWREEDVAGLALERTWDDLGESTTFWALLQRVRGG